MNKINDILKRSKFSNILTYLIYATVENETMRKKYDSTIDESYETFFTDMENLYHIPPRKDKKLFDIITKFACVHDDVYFEAGMLAGIQLYKELTEKHEPISKDIITILETRKPSVSTEYMRNSALESVCIHRLSTALEESLRNDTDYQKKEEEIQNMVTHIDKIGLTNEQWKSVDRVLSSYGARSAEYGKKAYIQGFKDVINLIITAVE